ncbi:hypothetical protein [Acidocella sp.]|uniref:hypothetical protein n=1 Tax=Acidocella sp. TaxID=50710 RepID=UPI00182FEDDA|nr:hypothetical protein [Acidocella sp.]NNM56313.1 hypothetical protein [Acidocella sp.]
MEVIPEEFSKFGEELIKLGVPLSVLEMTFDEASKSEYGLLLEKAFSSTMPTSHMLDSIAEKLQFLNDPLVEKLQRLNDPFGEKLLRLEEIAMIGGKAISLDCNLFDQTEEQKQKEEEFRRISLEFKENLYRRDRESRERRDDPPVQKSKPGRQIDDVRYILLARVQADMRRGTHMTRAIKAVLHLVPGDASDESKIKWFKRELATRRLSGH